MPTFENVEENSENSKQSNAESINKETCVACNSTIDRTCATNTTFEVFESCPLSVDPARCYHMINATTGEHTRGKSFGLENRN